MLRLASITIAALALSLTQTATAQPWHLAWSDEFNGPDNSGIDSSKWTAILGNDHGFGNHELETYTASRANLRQEHGHLVIEARREGNAVPDVVTGGYTSARIQTRDHFTAQYGRIEARMKLPLGHGLWPAFWMLGANIGTAGWPAAGEVDIMENIGEPRRVYGTIHGPGYSGAHGPQGRYNFPAHSLHAQAVNTGFHVYAVEWAPNRLTFSVDGHPYVTQTPRTIPPGTRWVYNHPFFLLLNLAVGGDWPKNPDATTHLPQQLQVDWVRVYQR